MKILCYIDAFGSKGHGGARCVFYETCKILLSMGHEIAVVCRDDGIEYASLPKGISFFAYKDLALGTMAKMLHYRNSIRKTSKKLLAELKPDLITIHSSSAVMGIHDLLKKSACPVIYIFHSPWSEEYKIMNENVLAHGNIFARFAIKFLAYARKIHEQKYLDISEGIITLSDYMKNMLADTHHSIKPDKIRVIPGGVDLSRFHPAKNNDIKQIIRKKLSLPEDHLLVITVRRLVPRTGIDILIRSLPLLLTRTKRKIKLIIVGDGPMFSELMKLSEELKLTDHVLFTGILSDKTLSEYYRASDIFVLPTKYLEGFGLSTVEALASGLLVLGTDIGGTREILSKISPNLLICECSESAIADKISEYLDCYEEVSKDFRPRAIELTDKLYNWKKHCTEILDLYNQLI